MPAAPALVRPKRGAAEGLARVRLRARLPRSSLRCPSQGRLILIGKAGLFKRHVSAPLDQRNGFGNLAVVGIECLCHHHEIGGFLRVTTVEGIACLLEELTNL
jgi:hypothetical protein